MAFDRDENESSYQTTSGLVEEFDGTVTDVLFTYDNAYSEDVAVLKMTVKADDESLFDGGDTPGETTILYPCGKGFEPTDKGAKIQHESGRAKRFNKNSGIGLLVDHAVELEGVIDVLKDRGPATVANVWQGLRFTFTEKEFTGKDRDGDEMRWTRMLPTAFLGIEGEGEAEAKPAKKAAAKKAAPAKPEPAEESNDGTDYELDAKTRGKLKAIASTAEDHNAFMEEAFATLELDDVAETAVSDEDFYNSLKAG